MASFIWIFVLGWCWAACDAQSNSLEAPRYPDLGIDDAAVRFINNGTSVLQISVVSDECYHCNPKGYLAVVPPRGVSKYFVLDTAYTLTFTLQYAGVVKTREYREQFDQHGAYTVHVLYSDSNYVVWVNQDQAPTYAYTPIFISLAIFVGAGLIWAGLSKIYYALKQRRDVARELANPYAHVQDDDSFFVSEHAGADSKRSTMSAYSASAMTHRARDADRGDRDRDRDRAESAHRGAERGEKDRSKTTRSGSERLKSLDAFRRFALAIMIFVNAGGGGYEFFSHSTWNGLFVADLVFPWFIWIMGTSMALAYTKLRTKRASKWDMLKKAIRRAVILFALGLFLNNGHNYEKWRIPGVLQRFGVCYLFVSLILIFCPFQEAPEIMGEDTSLREHVLDVTRHWVEWFIIALFIAAWTCITFLIPFENCPAGYLGPGILGCLTSISMVFFGVQAGRVIVYYKAHLHRVMHFVVWFFIYGVPALILSGGTRDGGWIPLNKNLWSLSFILALSSLGNLALALFYILIDWFKIWNGSPFYYTGMNSIVIYCGSEVLGGYFPFSYKYEQGNTHTQRYIAGLVCSGSWLLVGFYMWVVDFFVAV